MLHMCLLLCSLGLKVPPKQIQSAMFRLYCNKALYISSYVLRFWCTKLGFCDEGKAKRQIYFLKIQIT